MKRLKAIIKKPGKKPEVIEIDKRTGVNDTLGYSIGACKVASDLMITYDSRAGKKGEPFNFEAHGHKFFGPVLFVGIDMINGRTVFADAPELEKLVVLFPSLAKKDRGTLSDSTT